jgi:hypothetical protein
MTNQQLVLLIYSFRKRLSGEISRLREALPEGSERKEQQIYTGGGEANRRSTPTNDPRRWATEQSGDYVLLSGLVDLLTELDEAAEILRAGEQPPVNKE